MIRKDQKVLIVDDTPENISIISNALSDKKRIAQPRRINQYARWDGYGGFNHKPRYRTIVLCEE